MRGREGLTLTIFFLLYILALVHIYIYVCVLGTRANNARAQVCMDETADVLLAYKMNGKELAPDHGYPIRLIVPGYIGGRMVRRAPAGGDNWPRACCVSSSYLCTCTNL